jgi:hypothetical protein
VNKKKQKTLLMLGHEHVVIDKPMTPRRRSFCAALFQKAATLYVPTASVILRYTSRAIETAPL